MLANVAAMAAGASAAHVSRLWWLDPAGALAIATYIIISWLVILRQQVISFLVKHISSSLKPQRMKRKRAREGRGESETRARKSTFAVRLNTQEVFSTFWHVRVVSQQARGFHVGRGPSNSSHRRREASA